MDAAATNGSVDAGGTTLVRDDGRSPLYQTLYPGERTDLRLLITAPARPGDYLLDVREPLRDAGRAVEQLAAQNLLDDLGERSAGRGDVLVELGAKLVVDAQADDVAFGRGGFGHGWLSFSSSVTATRDGASTQGTAALVAA